MIRQKRRVQLDFRKSNEDSAAFTVGDLRKFLKAIDSHKLPDEQPIQSFKDPYTFGFKGFEAEWQEWENDA